VGLRRRPLTWKSHWNRIENKSGETNLASGICVEHAFPDPEGLLETGYRDLDNFMASMGLPVDAAYRIVGEQVPTVWFETFKLVIPL
jgi:hypothetical protein